MHPSLNCTPLWMPLVFKSVGVECEQQIVTTTTETKGGQPHLDCARYKDVVLNLKWQLVLACDQLGLP